MVLVQVKAHNIKVSEQTFRRVNRSVREFADEVTTILNYGKYSAQTLTTAPQWTARNGEFLFFQSSTSSGNRVYFYANNQWNWMSGSPTGGGSPPGGDDTQVQVNSQDLLFYADQGFRYVAGTHVAIGTDMKLVFNVDSSSNSYIVYTRSNSYLEFYVDSQLRLQM